MSFSDYCSENSEPRFSTWLAHTANPEWENGCTHAFTRAIGDDQMPRDAYVRYLIEDYAFITDLASMLGYLVAQAPSMASKRRLSGFLAALTSEENDFFLRSFEALDVSPEVYLQATQGPVTQAFSAHMLGSAKESYAKGLACLLCAEWMYLTWAVRENKKPRPAAFYLFEWIDLHASDDFIGFVNWIREEMDAVGPKLDTADQNLLASTFKQMATLEVAFFDHAMAGEE